MTAPTVLTIVLDAMGKDTLERYLLLTGKERRFPTLETLGLGNILAPQFHGVITPTEADVAMIADPSSRWADSVMGHRELMGFIDPTDYDLFMAGFPPSYVSALEEKINRPVLFNKRAGGDEAIAANHDEHIRTRGVILYASMCDPIAQFAADESIIPVGELTDIGETGFTLALEMGIRVTRVITRPYVVKGEKFDRTANRRDIVIALPQDVTTFIDVGREYGIRTVSIGKCADVVNTEAWYEDRDVIARPLPRELQGLYTSERKNDKNPYSLYQAVLALQEAARAETGSFIMCNLPDTDSLFGHVRNAEGSLDSLEAFDKGLEMVLQSMPENGVVLVTADHGMRDGGDYGYHAREAVPVLGKAMNGRLRERIQIPRDPKTYAVVGDMIANIFGIQEQYRERCQLDGLL